MLTQALFRCHPADPGRQRGSIRDGAAVGVLDAVAARVGEWLGVEVVVGWERWALPGLRPMHNQRSELHSGATQLFQK